MIAALLMIAALAGEMPAPKAADVLAGLTGGCFRTDISDGMTDTHCFSVGIGGLTVMDIHKVRKGRDVVYEGVTIYRAAGHPDVLDYAYYNSDGDLLPGYAYRDGDDIRFPATPDVLDVPISVWRLTADGYDVIIAGKLTRHFVRTSAAGDTGF